MYAVIDIYAINLSGREDLNAAGQLIARSLDPLGWVSAKIHDCTNDPAAGFPAMLLGRDYEVIAVPQGLRLRAAAVGIRAEHALMRCFNDDTCIEVAIPTFKNPRRLRELLAAFDSGSEWRIDQAGGRLFRSLFPRRITDARMSRILREHLPRVYPRSHSTISGRHPQYPTENSNVH
jgi:hypothetical protein